MEGYEIVRQLGKGGMGTAYCVRKHSGDGGFLAVKQVAVKNVAEGNEALREAKTLQVDILSVLV
jgi:serine/threonine protein kinase